MVPTATRSPGVKLVTAGPAAATVPVNSWPGTVPPSAVLIRPWSMCRSLWQTPQ
jgi:hypothetical protein